MSQPHSNYQLKSCDIMLSYNANSNFFYRKNHATGGSQSVDHCVLAIACVITQLGALYDSIGSAWSCYRRSTCKYIIDLIMHDNNNCTK